MCDKCGTIFSENDEDWSTFSGSVKRRREDGSRYSETVSQDACSACTGGTQPVTPRVLGPGAAPFPGPASPAPRADPAYTAALEHELGMDHDQQTHAGGPYQDRETRPGGGYLD
jgi:hypothetical protein